MNIFAFIKKLFANPNQSKRFIDDFMEDGCKIHITSNEAAIVLKETGVKFYLPAGYPNKMGDVKEDILVTMEYLLHAAHRDDWKLEYAQEKIAEEEMEIMEYFKDRRATFEVIEGGKNDDET